MRKRIEIELDGHKVQETFNGIRQRLKRVNVIIEDFGEYYNDNEEGEGVIAALVDVARIAGHIQSDCHSAIRRLVETDD